ncbi:MAG: FHA domain-containing protein [Deltaproteobacteria bacterium]|nr:FHA domain-containing protein [Deltaproteobacteria bacterium]
MSPSLKETMPGRVAGLPRPGGPPPLRPGMNRPSSPPTLPRPPGTGAVPSRPPVPPTPRPSATGQIESPGTGSGVELPGLTLIFQGRKIPITSGQFIIGRGSKASDLAIKDANISRKHAAIIFHNGAYYLKDLGSTNGIEYKGQQVDSKRIDEGDVFSICGYELHFTYGV